MLSVYSAKSLLSFLLLSFVKISLSSWEEAGGMGLFRMWRDPPWLILNDGKAMDLFHEHPMYLCTFSYIFVSRCTYSLTYKEMSKEP